MNRWLLLHLKMCNSKMLASSSRPQMNKSSCSFNMVKLKVNEQWCLIGMLDAGMRINDNIDPNWTNELKCKKKKKLAHEVISGSNHPPQYRANQYCQYNLLQQWKWVHFTFEVP